MKKLFCILFSLLIVLSGMHLSFATHFCGGEIAAVKWSLSGEKATCGMENEKQNFPSQKSISSNCCHNKIANYSVDNNYNPSSYQIKDVTKCVSQFFTVPFNTSLYSINISNSLNANVYPPGEIITSAVSLADICIFRI